MDKQVISLLCIIVLMLIIIMEKGVPVKLRKIDYVIYAIVYLVIRALVLWVWS